MNENLKKNYDVCYNVAILPKNYIIEDNRLDAPCELCRNKKCEFYSYQEQ